MKLMNLKMLKIKYSAIVDAIAFIRSDEYKALELIPSLEISKYE